MGSFLEIKNLSKCVKKHYILKNINLSVYKGEIIGIIGLNGSGKTTLFKSILGLISYSGDIYIEKENINNKHYKKCGFMIENPSLYNNMTGYENLLYWSKFYDNISEHDINELLKLVQLEDKKKKVRNYSLGMKQRLSFCIAVIHKPNLLLLDDPTNGLDINAIVKIRKIIQNMNNTSILISSHDINELINICNRIILIKNGQVVKEISKNSFRELNQNYILDILGC